MAWTIQTYTRDGVREMNNYSQDQLINEINELQKENSILKSHNKRLQDIINRINYRIFKWHKCKRKNGTEFLKLIYYSPLFDGYVEAGRFNISKHEVIQNEWSIDEILRELE